MKFGVAMSVLIFALGNVSVISAFASGGKLDDISEVTDMKNANLNLEHAKLLIARKFENHISDLPNKNTWVFNPKYKSSIKNIRREIINSMLDTSPYNRSARYSDGRTIAEFCETDNFVHISKYMGANWNYVVLMNLLQNMRNGNIQAIKTEDKAQKEWLLNSVILDIRNAWMRNASQYDYDKTPYVASLKKATIDIQKYFDALDLWNFVLQVKQEYYKPPMALQKNGSTLPMQITKDHLPNGINNESATCYLNAALQCLYNSAPIRTAIQTLSKSEQNKLAKSINSIFEQLAKGNGGSVNFKGAIKQLAKDIRMPKVANQDPSEAIGNILDMLIDQEIATGLQEIEKIYSQSSEQSKKAQESEKLRHESTIGRICDFQYADILICDKCDNHSMSNARVTKLDLSLQQAKQKNSSLRELIQLFETEEVLTNDNPWRCPSCGHSVQASKRIALHTLPKVCIINLKKYAYSNRIGRTDSSEILCPNIIKIRQYTYKLRSFVYGGDLRGGHIIMSGYADDGTPYTANDANVSRSPSNKLSTEKAQMVVYELME